MMEIVALDAQSLRHHLDALTEVLHACVHDGASVGYILPFGHDEARAFWTNAVAPGVAAGTRVLLGATIDGVAAGTVQLDLDTKANQRHRADVSKLLVHPRHRRKGLGRALMLAVEPYAVQAQRWLLTLDTAGEAAEALYTDLGYQTAGRIPFYARDALVERYDPTIVMFKTLAGAPRSR